MIEKIYKILREILIIGDKYQDDFCILKLKEGYDLKDEYKYKSEHEILIDNERYFLIMSCKTYNTPRKLAWRGNPMPEEVMIQMILRYSGDGPKIRFLHMPSPMFWELKRDD